MELVAGAGDTSQPQALEAMVGLQVCKAHFDALALIARFEKGFGLHLSPQHRPTAGMKAGSAGCKIPQCSGLLPYNHVLSY